MTENNAWMARAACRPASGVDPEIFFPQHDSAAPIAAKTRPGRKRNPTTSAQAKAVCKGCEVTGPCLLYALSLRVMPPGVWGGLSERQRRRLRGDGELHGSMYVYLAGCRCDACCEAHDDDLARRAARRRGLLPCPKHLHGSEYAYTGYHCRCEPCVAAHDETLKGRRTVIGATGVR